MKMSPMEQPLVSVLTPVYNGEPYLGECIESVLNQTYQNFEYIIVNNCSKDRTLEIAREYEKKNRRVRVHDNDEFLGVIANHNHAFKMMSKAAKYCKVVSGDDFIFPECLVRLVEFAEANPSVGMVGSYSIAGKRVEFNGLTYEEKVSDGRKISRATLLGGPYVFGAPTSLLYRADYVRRTDAFYPSPNPHSDTTACFQSLLDSDFGYVHQILSYTRIHPASQTSKSLRHGTINLAKLSDLARFGPKLLNSSEYDECLSRLTGEYYWAIVPTFLAEPRNKEFWDRQKTELKEVGLEFSYTKLLKATFLKGVKLVLAPGSALRKLRSIWGDSKKIKAQYYDQST
jgi:glycosyltransferase involved in cell wall biosynthesis